MNIAKLLRRDAQLASLLAYVRDTQAPRLHGYHGTDVDLILHLLHQPLPPSTATHSSQYPADRRTTEPAVVRPSMSTLHWEHLEQHEHDLMHEIAHGLHFASIAMLGFLVLEVNVSCRVLHSPVFAIQVCKLSKIGQNRSHHV